jgi:hypothetical protein
MLVVREGVVLGLRLKPKNPPGLGDQVVKSSYVDLTWTLNRVVAAGIRHSALVLNLYAPRKTSGNGKKEMGPVCVCRWRLFNSNAKNVLVKVCNVMQIQFALISVLLDVLGDLPFGKRPDTDKLKGVVVEPAGDLSGGHHKKYVEEEAAGCSLSYSAGVSEANPASVERRRLRPIG